jgi:TRAP-type mannitol/chloroaromatic compound transport system permease small subunit
LEKNEEINQVNIESLLAIQKEMLHESRRLGLMTAWLILLTAVLTAASVVAIVAAR